MKPRHQKPLIALALAAIAFAATPANAAVTFFSDSLLNDVGNQISSWSSSAVTKTSDIGADNRYGTDGYTWMNANNSGTVTTALASIAESAPSYASGGIAYTGATTEGGSGVSGSFSGADDRLLPNGTGTANVGYAGVNYFGATGNPQNTMQQLFAYTMTRSMNIGETIRLGVVLDSLSDAAIGANALRIVAGGTADATGVASRSGVMDMYFFDITGLTSGQNIEIWASKTGTNQANGFRAITIGGVTFDSVPEPSTTLLGALGFLALFRRRR
jgi:hypothetical protein